MGIVNVTPDSFSDGGAFFEPDRALEHAHLLVEEGADIIDIGAESTRPGAKPIALEDELRRLMPVLDRLRDLPVPVSVDTMKAEVMRRAIGAGASMVNDVSALRDPDAIGVLAGSDAAICLMHMRGDPRTMQVDPTYPDVVGEVTAYLEERVSFVQAAGIDLERIAVDPGFGFGKTRAHNLALFRALDRLRPLGAAVLVGLSRKSVLGKIIGRGADDRLAGSVAAALLAVQRGADIVRVHDVAPTRDALIVWRAVEGVGC